MGFFLLHMKQKSNRFEQRAIWFASSDLVTAQYIWDNSGGAKSNDNTIYFLKINSPYMYCWIEEGFYHLLVLVTKHCAFM